MNKRRQKQASKECGEGGIRSLANSPSVMVSLSPKRDNNVTKLTADKKIETVIVVCATVWTALWIMLAMSRCSH